MSYNNELWKKSLVSITKNAFKKAIVLAFKDGIESKALLGYSGKTIVLFGYHEHGRVNLITVRNHSGIAQLLITNSKGKFLFLGGFSEDLDYDMIAQKFYEIFKSVKKQIK